MILRKELTPFCSEFHCLAFCRLGINLRIFLFICAFNVFIFFFINIKGHMLIAVFIKLKFTYPLKIFSMMTMMTLMMMIMVVMIMMMIMMMKWDTLV